MTESAFHVPKLRAVIYARQSLDPTNTRNGVDRQVEDARDLCRRRDYDIVAVLIDNSVSASGPRRDAEYQKLLTMMRTGQVDRVVVQHTDRLYRSMTDLERLVDLSESTGVRIDALFGEIDLATDTGRLLARILAAVARAEVERKSARQRRANRQRRERGEAAWGRRPFGYDRDDDRVPVIVAVEAAALRESAELVLDGSTLAECVRRLNDAGIPTSTGTPWQYTSLRRALISPRYAGQVAYLGVETGVGGKWPALWDADTAERLREVLTAPERLRSARGSERGLRHWLSGALTCGACGSAMYHGGDRRPAYLCRCRKVARDAAIVEGAVEARLLRRLSDPEFAASWADGDEGELTQARIQLADRRRAREAIADAMADGLIPEATARSRLDRLRGEIAALEATVAGASTSPVDRFLASGVSPAEYWAAMTVVERRTLILAAARSVVVMPIGKGVRTEVRLVQSVVIEWV